jgi:hypothetical protein
MISSVKMNEYQYKHNETNKYHELENTWIFWYHLPHDVDWSIKSYKQIGNFKCIEDVISILSVIPENIINSCCLFIMKDNIMPLWEDIANRNGGSFSYRITNKHVYETWRDLTYALTGGTISSNKIFRDTVNGISISPKKNFCVIKIWTKTCNFQNPALITNEIKNLISNTALFKNHTPEF